MKKTLIISILIFCQTVFAQTDSLILSISPMINKSDRINNRIISTLDFFLATKDSSLTENNYWLDSDFTNYIKPYYALSGIERSRYGENFYQPSLMEIIATNDKSKRIVKIAFIGHNEETKENTIRLIYNIVANIYEEKIVFSKYLDYSTSNWQVIEYGSIRYYISPQKSANMDEMQKQKTCIDSLCSFFESKPITCKYYSCISPIEYFSINGFDYNPAMYIDKSGGSVEDDKIIFSGNSSEYYNHEVTHIYVNELFPEILPFFNEGIATYFGGSGRFDYKWQKQKFRKFLKENSNYKLDEHMNVYEWFLYEGETPVNYMIAALTIERILRVYGKEKLFELFRSGNELWEILSLVGLSKENFNTEIRKEVNNSL